MRKRSSIVLCVLVLSLGGGAVLTNAAVSSGVPLPAGAMLAASAAASQQPASAEPPARLLEALPDGSVILADQQGPFVDNGGTQWVVLWTEPGQDSPPLPLHVGVVAPFVEAPWQLLWSIPLATTNAAGALLIPLPVGMPDAFAVVAPTGPCGTQLTLFRWDGTIFATLFSQAFACNAG